MRFLGRDIPNVVLLLPLLAGTSLLGYSVYQLTNEVRSSFVFIGLYALFGVVAVLLYYWLQPLTQGPRQALVSPFLARRTLSICFFGALIGAILGLEFLSNGATRPPVFFGFVAVAIGILLVRSILFAGSQRDAIWSLGLFLLLGAVLRLAMVYLNPYPYVSDTQFHWFLIQKTISNNAFVEGGVYQAHPLFHVFNASFLLLVDSADAPSSLFPLLNSLVIVGAIPVTYLIGRFLGTVRTGLFACGILLFSGRFFPSLQYKTNWFGIVFLLLAFLIILTNLARSNRAKHELMFWILSVGVLLIHPINFVVLLILISGGFVAIQIRLLRLEKVRSFRDWVTPVPLLTAGTLFIAYLSIVNNRVFSSLIISAVGISTSGSQRLGLTTNIATVPLISEFTFELVINLVGLAAPVVGIVFGILIMLEEIRTPSNTTAIGLVALYVFVFGVLVTGRGGELSITRFLLYIAPIGAVAAGVGIDRFESRAGSTRILAIFVFAVVILSFLAMSSYINSGGIFTNAIQTSPSTTTASTMAAHQFLTFIPAGAEITGTDTTNQYIASTNPVRGMHQVEDGTTVRKYYQPGWNTSQYYLLNRETLSMYHSQTGPDYRRLPLWVTSGHSRIYATTEFAVYHRPERRLADSQSERLYAPNMAK